MAGAVVEIGRDQIHPAVPVDIGGGDGTRAAARQCGGGEAKAATAVIRENGNGAIRVGLPDGAADQVNFTIAVDIGDSEPNSGGIPNQLIGNGRGETDLGGGV